VPYETAEAAARLSSELGVPWVADLQDPWALDEMWLYPSGLHRRMDMRRMERLLSSAEAIVMNTPEASRRVAERMPHLATRLTPAIPNGFDATDFEYRPPRRADAAFRIVHTGYLHTELGLRQRTSAPLRRLLGGESIPGVDILTRSHVFLLQAVDELLASDPTLVGKIEVHLAGELTDADRAVPDRNRVVRYRGYLAHDKTVDLMRSADVLFLPMQDLPAGVRAGLVPGKTYEYLASSRPILAAVPPGDARDLLLQAGNASICDPGDVASMARAISEHVTRWRDGAAPARPEGAVLARYERRQLTVELASVFDGVLERRGGRADTALAVPAMSA
jgi:glycosyltransferase involved in cell wall biosynthesis